MIQVLTQMRPRVVMQLGLSSNMILAKVQMQFLSGPKFTDVEIVDSCPRYSWSVGLLVCKHENSRTALRIS